MIPSSSQLGKALIANIQNKPDTLEIQAQALRVFLDEYHLSHLLPQICRYVQHTYNIQTQSQGCHITTALSMDDLSRNQLLQALNINVQDDYRTYVDESLIGGCTIANKGVLYDASIKTSLERLYLVLQD